MKCYEVVGYAMDGEVYCVDCITEQEQVYPIFAEAEFIGYAPCCAECGEALDVQVIEAEETQGEDY